MGFLILDFSLLPLIYDPEIWKKRTIFSILVSFSEVQKRLCNKHEKWKKYACVMKFFQEIA